MVHRAVAWVMIGSQRQRAVAWMMIVHNVNVNFSSIGFRGGVSMAWIRSRQRKYFCPLKLN
jgi:hypothetical protein